MSSVTMRRSKSSEREAFVHRPVIKRYPEPFNLAFIEASSTGIPPLRWAAFAPEIGSPVFLIGTPEIGNDNGPPVASGTLITGVVSNYLEMGLMITDAQISTGTCGGPLLNARGEVVGIARPATNRPGINFVLPSHNVEGRVPDWQYMLSRTIERAQPMVARVPQLILHLRYPFSSLPVSGAEGLVVEPQSLQRNEKGESL